MEPREILPGVFHWTATHPKIGVAVSSYLLADARVLLDPLLPDGGVDWLCRHGPPEHVILTNRHHWRHCSELVDAFGHHPRSRERPLLTIWCNARGLHEVEKERGADHVRGYRAGDVLVGGIESYEVGVLCPDETALRFAVRDDGACLAVADGVVRIGKAGIGDGPLVFVPDELLADGADEAARVKAGLRRAYRKLCDLEWDTLLLAHGLPVVGDGRAQLRRFADA